MIQIEKIDFGYTKHRKVFSNLSLNLESGHIYGLLGKNGMGKTTLLKVIAGLRFCSTGKVTILDQNAESRKPEMLADIFFLTEEMNLPSVSIKQFYQIYAPFYPNFSYNEYDNYLQKFEINDYNAKLINLSHGQKKKVLVSFALACNTKILIMDEPTNGMDIPSKSVFRKVVASAITPNRTMIISTHQVRDLQNLIDSIIVLDNGKILLNENLLTISNKLSFKLLTPSQLSELTKQGKVLYSEDNIAGKIAVIENSEDDEPNDNFDMELLFCAVTAEKERIFNLFTKNKKSTSNENQKSNFAMQYEEMLNSKEE